MTATDVSKCVMFAGGGTGGHLFPGVAVAREVLRRDSRAQVVFVGTGRPIEVRVLSAEGLCLERIRAVGLFGRSVTAKLTGLVTLFLGFVDAALLLRRYQPHLVVGLGGYSSGALVLMAVLRGVPTLLLEQNVVPGFTNQLLGRVVRAAAVTYEGTLPHFGGRGFVTGNPVRAGFFEVDAARRVLNEAHILVLGGSQGAHAINMAMADAAARLVTAACPVRVTHQSGHNDLEILRKAYLAAGLRARVEPFLDAMEQEMADADIVVCRAGATTLAELAAAGRPAILVPYPHAVNDHQRRNAQVADQAGAAEVIDPVDLTGAVVAERLLALIGDDQRRVREATASRRLGTPGAVAAIVNRMEDLLRRH